MFRSLHKRVALNTKLIASFILVGILPFALLSWIELRGMKTVLTAEVKNKLLAVSEIKKNQVEDYISSRINDMRVLSNSQSIPNAIRAFAFAFQLGGSGGEIWNEAEKMIGLQLKPYQESYGYSDLFLVSSEGIVVYSITQGGELGADLNSEAFSGTGLARSFHRAFEQGLVFEDFSLYGPSGDPAAFIAASILDETNIENKHVGSVIFMLSHEQLGRFMSERTGLGKTGETYLVGSDGLMRSDSYRDNARYSVKASFKKNSKINTITAGKALSGGSGVEIITSYLDSRVLSAYMPVKVGSVKWGLIAEIDINEAFASVSRAEKTIMVAVVVVALLIVIVGIFISRSISRPVQTVINSLSKESEQLSMISGQISGSSRELSKGASEQAAALEETSASMEQIAAQSRKNAENAISSTESMEDMSQLLKQSVDNANLATGLSSDARNSADGSTKAMAEIVEAMKKIIEDSRQITDIVKVIDDITQQTKMLATNAAIEAARAGDHGKGFAVVANEVSKLAENSKESAKKIASLTKVSMKHSETGADLAEKGEQVLGDILDKSIKLADLIEEISASAGEQETKMEQVSGMLQGIKVASEEQAKGIEQVSLALTQMDSVTQKNAATAEESAGASDNLTSQARSQNEIIGKLIEIVGGVVSSAASAVSVTRKGLTGTADSRAYGKEKRREAGVILNMEEDTGMEDSGAKQPGDLIPMRDDFKDFMVR